MAKRKGVQEPLVIGAGIWAGAVSKERTSGPLKCVTRAPSIFLSWLTREEEGMEPLKNLMERAWEGLTEGWRELLTRGSGALTHFGTGETRTIEAQSEFPKWGLLAAETWETALSVVIRVEIPGMDADDLAIDIHENVLRIRGEKRPGSVQEGRQYHLMERAYGYFNRSIPLPHGVDTDNAEVSYRDGVLTVILPKTDTLPPRRLTISN